jgi:hypothetical protein
MYAIGVTLVVVLVLLVILLLNGGGKTTPTHDLTEGSPYLSPTASRLLALNLFHDKRRRTALSLSHTFCTGVPVNADVQAAMIVDICEGEYAEIVYERKTDGCVPAAVNFDSFFEGMKNPSAFRHCLVAYYRTREQQNKKEAIYESRIASSLSPGRCRSHYEKMAHGNEGYVLAIKHFVPLVAETKTTSEVKEAYGRLLIQGVKKPILERHDALSGLETDCRS